MHQVPVQIIIAAYSDEDEAGRRLQELKLGRRVGLIGIHDAAAVVKDGDGKLKVTSAKHRGRQGLLTGGIVGGLVGVLAGPVGWAAVGGGAIGSLTGRARNAPLKGELLAFGESLPAGSSALVALVEHTWVERLQAEFAAESARLVLDEMHEDIAQQLTGGGNVSYSFAGSEFGSAGARLASSADGDQIVTGFLASGEGLLVVEAEFTQEELAGDPAVEGGSAPR